MKYITGVLCCLVVLVGCGTGKGAAKDNKTVEQNTTTKIDTALGYNDELPAWFTEMLGYLDGDYSSSSYKSRKNDYDVKSDWLDDTQTVYQSIFFHSGHTENGYFPGQVTSTLLIESIDITKRIRKEIITALNRRQIISSDRSSNGGDTDFVFNTVPVSELAEQTGSEAYNVCVSISAINYNLKGGDLVFDGKPYQILYIKTYILF